MKKILLVDDNEMQLTIVSNVLNQKYEITTAESGKEAVGYLSKGYIPNLILLDILMPEMDGWETYSLIKGLSLLRDVPIVFFTSLDTEKDKERASRLGAAGFITKPFDAKELMYNVDSIIEKRA
ncbi:MAG: response regulator [Treponema sp.]|nr:response regulator [Treponema sp.]